MNQVQFSPYIQKYDKKDVSMGEVLGQGSFGVVQKGQIKGVDVALKIIKVSAGLKQDAEVELHAMAQFSHINVLKLLGILGENFLQKPILIFEFMEYGSLLEFVKSTSSDDNILVSLAYDVACGMDYLHEMQYVHRDLAGRNVLVDSSRRAKVADFGLSRFVDTDTSSYYRIEQNKPLPFRWVPKESIPSDNATGRFTFASDVWSFGVTMWETWTAGALLPYSNISSNNEVIKVIQQGKNPNSFQKPRCPPKILEIMEMIFKVDPQQRPSFAELKIKLKEIKIGKPPIPQRPPVQVPVNYYDSDESQVAKALENLTLKSSSAGHVQLIQKLKENGRIKTGRVEEVMRAVDRSEYVTSQNPYNDRPQSIGCNVNISAPHMHAFMLELVAERLSSGGKGLDIGSGSGYITACMGLLVGPSGKVVGIDHMNDLAKQSINNIKKSYPEMIEKGIIRIVVGDGRKGFAEGGPYDVIHIGACTPLIQQALTDQLREGGRIVTPVGPAGDSQELVVVDKIGGVLHKKKIMGVIFASLTTPAEQLKK